jgi:tetratricopeptide (TPR) repeat protein
MTDSGLSELQSDLAYLTRAAVEKSEHVTGLRRNEPADVGDLFLLPETQAFPLEWLVVGRHPVMADLFRLVPADTNPLPGPLDVMIPAGSPAGPLCLRCAFSIWIEESFLHPELRTGLVERDDVEEALKRCHSSEARDLTVSAREEGRGNPELEEWTREILSPAWQALSTAIRHATGPRHGHPASTRDSEGWLTRSRAAAPGLWAELRSRPFEQQRNLVEVDEQFQSLGLCELLCVESRRAAPSDPLRATELAELAVFVSSVLDEEGVPPACRLEARTLAWSHLGNVRRTQGKLREADEAFQQIACFREAGTEDVLGHEAQVLSLLASLRRDQRRFSEALALLDRALVVPSGRTYRGLLLVCQAAVCRNLGDDGRALALLQEATAVIDPDDSRLYYCLHHTLLFVLNGAGRHSDAKKILPLVEQLCREHGGTLDRVRVRWMEASITAGLGKIGAAIEILEEVRRDFLAHGMSYDTALVSLDLAALYAEASQPENVKALALDTVPIFQVHKIPREMLAALTLFLQAAETDAANAVAFRRIAEELRKAQGGQSPAF